MKIGSTSENKSIEKRIAITPEVAKKYISLGIEVSLLKNYGSHIGIDDSLYSKIGVKIINDEKKLINNSDLILQLNLLCDENISFLNKNQSLIGVFDAYNNKKKIEILTKKNINILLGIGGSGDTKRVAAEKYIEFIKLCTNNYECKFFLAAGKKYEEQEILKKIFNSNFKNYCKALDDLTISETLPIIKNCNLAVCNDTSFSHLSAALEIETIVLMTDSPLLYGSYSPKMHPIIPDGEKTVTHNTLGKDKINPEKIFNKMKEILKLS